MIPKPPPPSSLHVSKSMHGNKSRDTKPELQLRKLLTELGYRYRLHPKHLPGKPDLFFSSRKKVIFVHGCFWHQHKDSKCPLKSVRPRTNSSYWNAKLDRNIERDKQHKKKLASIGLQIMIVWECQLKNPVTLSLKLINFLGDV